VWPGGSSIPLLMLCVPEFAVSSPVGLTVCPSAGVVKPAGASVWDCCPATTIAAAPIMEKIAMFLCFNGFDLLERGFDAQGPSGLPTMRLARLCGAGVQQLTEGSDEDGWLNSVSTT
jgi:hypothetical protein